MSVANYRALRSGTVGVKPLFPSLCGGAMGLESCCRVGGRRGTDCPFPTPPPRTVLAPFSAECDPQRSWASDDRLRVFRKFFRLIHPIVSLLYGSTPSFTYHRRAENAWFRE